MATAPGVYSGYFLTKQKPSLLGYRLDYLFLQSRLEAPTPSDSKCPAAWRLNNAPALPACPGDGWSWCGSSGDPAALDTGWIMGVPIPIRLGSLPQQSVPTCFVPEFSELQYTGLNGNHSTSEQEGVVMETPNCKTRRRLEATGQNCLHTACLRQRECWKGHTLRYHEER